MILSFEPELHREESSTILTLFNSNHSTREKYCTYVRTHNTPRSVPCIADALSRACIPGEIIYIKFSFQGAIW